MIEIKNKKNYIHLFDNILDLTNYLDRKNQPNRKNESDDSDSSFSGTKNFKEAYELLKYGDDELYTKVKSEKIKVTSNLGNVKKRQNYENNVYGCIPNVPVFLKGCPINMINYKQSKISHKVINIYLSVGVSGDNDKKEIIRIGAKYLQIIELLEKSGYRCNLYAGVSAKNERGFWGSGIEGPTQHMYLRIKTDREPFNIKKICFPIAHPSMLRRIYLKWAEVNTADGDITHNGYGSVMSEDAIKKALDKELDEDLIIWGYSQGTKTKSLEDILEDLKKRGISIDVEEN